VIDPAQLGPGAAIGILLIAAVTIIVGGSRFTYVADRLADITGWGEALFGGVLVGATTSLPGLMASVTAAASGHAELAFANALGGIAAQTFFLAIADMIYRPANLEHAAASLSNMVQGTLLIALLAIVLLLMASPAVSLAGVHPGSLALVIAYVFGLRIVRRAERGETWSAVRTAETVMDQPSEEAMPTGRALTLLWVRFVVLGVIVAIAGYAVAQAGIALAAQTKLSETVVGVFLTAIVTSLPELATAVAAVRQGALTLAVGNIIGGNSFDVLFVAFADFAFREGSIYAALGFDQVFVIALAITMTAVLLLGLLRRERHGIANIGFESFLILVLYLGGCGVLFWVG